MAMSWDNTSYLKSPPILPPRDLKQVAKWEVDAERRECARGLREKEFRRNIARWCAWGIEAVCVAQGVYAWQRFAGSGGEDTFGTLSLPAFANYFAQFGQWAQTGALFALAAVAGIVLLLMGLGRKGTIVLSGSFVASAYFGIDINLDMALVTVANVAIILLGSSLAAEMGKMEWVGDNARETLAKFFKGICCAGVVAFSMVYSIGSSAYHLGMVAQGAVEAAVTEGDRVAAQGVVVDERSAQVDEAASAYRQAAVALETAEADWRDYKTAAEAMNASDRAWVMRPDATASYFDAIEKAKARAQKRLEAWEVARDKLAEARERKSEIAVESNEARAIIESAAAWFGYSKEQVGQFNLHVGVAIAVLMDMLRIAAASLLNTSLRHSLAWMRDQQAEENLRAAEREIDRQDLEDAREAPDRAKRKVEIAAARARGEMIEEYGETEATRIRETMRADFDDLNARLEIPPMPSERAETAFQNVPEHAPAPDVGPVQRVVAERSGTGSGVSEHVSGETTIETLTPMKRQRVHKAMENVKRGSRPQALTANGLREWGGLYGDDERRVFCAWLVERGMAEAPVVKGQGYAWRVAA